MTKPSTLETQIETVQRRLARLSRCRHKMSPKRDALLAEALTEMTTFLDHLQAGDGDRQASHPGPDIPMDPEFPLTGGTSVRPCPMRRLGRADQDQRDDGTRGAPSVPGHLQTRKHLKESEAQFRLIAETIKDVFWMRAPGTPEVFYVSPAYEEVWGRSCRSLYESPQSFSEAVHPADRERLERSLENRAEDKWEAQYRIIRPDGQVRWIHDQGYPIRDETGALLGRAGVARDITNLKHDEELRSRLWKRAESQRAWLRTILKNAPAGICVADGAKLRVRYANSTCADLLRRHCPGGRIVGSSLVEVFARAGLPPVGGVSHAVLDGDQPSLCDECQLIGPDGTTRHIRRTTVPMRERAKHGPDIMMLLDDVTELVEARDGFERRVRERTTDLETTIDELQAEARDRIEAEDRLKRERQRLYSLLNIMPGYVCLIDKDHTFRFVNHKFLELIGEPAGRRCYEMLRGQDHVCQACNLRRVLDTGQLQQWERTTSDGTAYRVWGYPFTDIDGAQLVLELGMDVTHLRHLEQEVVRISELEQQRFGRELHDSIGQVLTGLGFLTKALQNRLMERGSSEADSAGQIAALLKQAVVQTRFLAKGLLPVDPEMGGLCAVLDELAGSVEHVHHVSCSFHSQCDVSSLDTAAAAHMYRIAQEAVNNAIKHAKPENIDITLRREGEALVLTVANDGLSPSEPLDKTKGLGLRIMAYRASVLGGSVRVSARAAGGTVVLCEAPATGIQA